MFGRSSKSGKKPAKEKPAKGKKAPKAKAAKKAKTPKAPKVKGPPAKSDVYTLLLGLAFLATLIGVVFLTLEAQRYEFDFKGANAAVPAGLVEFAQV